MVVYDPVESKLFNKIGIELHTLRSVARAAGYKSITDLALSMRLSRQWLYHLYQEAPIELADRITAHLSAKSNEDDVFDI
jgi:hypothetical protein